MQEAFLDRIPGGQDNLVENTPMKSIETSLKNKALRPIYRL